MNICLALTAFALIVGADELALWFLVGFVVIGMTRRHVL